MKYVFYFILLVTQLSFSQNDSLRSLLDYYPLQKGNYWEYETFVQQFPYPIDSSAYSIEIKGDTVLINKKNYKIFFHKYLFPGYSSYYTYERIDSLTGCVYRYISDTATPNKEIMTDSLFARPGDTINASREGYYQDMRYRTIYDSVQKDTLFGKSTEIKIYLDQTVVPLTEYEYAQGFGFLSSSSCEFSCGSTYLKYAKINGNEYGKKIITDIKRTENRVYSFSLYQNYPNPFNPSTEIIFEIPKSGMVTFRVYDIIGRLIKSETYNNMAGGIHKLKFNGEKYSSGIYLYQIEYQNNVQSKKMLLLK